MQGRGRGGDGGMWRRRWGTKGHNLERRVAENLSSGEWMTRQTAAVGEPGKMGGGEPQAFSEAKADSR